MKLLLALVMGLVLLRVTWLRAQERLRRRGRLGPDRQEAPSLLAGSRPRSARAGEVIDLIGTWFVTHPLPWMAFGYLLVGDRGMATGVILGLIFGAVADIYQSNTREGQIREMEEQLPAALEAIVEALRTEQGLVEGLAVAARRVDPPLSHELRRAWGRAMLGVDPGEVLSELSARNPGVHGLATAMAALRLQRETGGSVAPIREIATGLFRTHLARLRGEANLAEASMGVAVLASLLPVVLLLVALGRPDYLAPLWTHPLGRQWLLLAALAYVLGWWLARRVARLAI